MKSAIPYHGGKWYQADDIIKLMPEHKIYIENYFGSGAVFFKKQKKKGVIEIVNDLDSNLTTFWSVLADSNLFEDFKRIIDATPFSQICYDKAVKTLEIGGNPIEVAVSYYIVARQSMAGRQDTFRPLTTSRTRGGVSAETNSWWNSIERLPEIRDRLKDVVILNMKALDVLKKYGNADTVAYLDPPYYHPTRVSKNVYRFEMTEAEHEDMLSFLSAFKGKFLLSGYESDLYEKHEKKNGWNKHFIMIANHSSGKVKKDVKKECIWTNY